jgi:hypothetical protein
MNLQNKIRQRFISDYNLPIQVYQDGLFEYFLSLYEKEFQSETKWNEFNEMIKTHYNGKEGVFLEDYYNARNHIITSIENSDAYKQFNTCNMNDYAITNDDFKSLSKSSPYLETNDGKIFLSIDMKQANFNTLKYHDRYIVRNANDYNDFIVEMIGKHHNLIEYFQKSKYNRQVIFGKLNMARNMTIQKYIMSKLFEIINKAAHVFKPYSYQSDELIYQINDKAVADSFDHLTTQMTTIEKIIKHDIKDIPFKCELFFVKCHKFTNSNDAKLVAYTKNSLLKTNDNINLKMCPITYYAQVYKLLQRQPITKNDLSFYYEKQLARFFEPIKFA